jgi:hypothetical protein
VPGREKNSLFPKSWQKGYSEKKKAIPKKEEEEKVTK